MMWILTALSALAAVYADYLDVEELSSASDLVVLGEVSEVESRRVPGGIVTEVTVDVSETLLGPPTFEVTLTLPGGRVSRDTLTVSGVPRLLVGHDLLLFLDDDGHPVAFTQGIFFVDGQQAYSATHNAVVPIEEVRRVAR